MVPEMQMVRTPTIPCHNDNVSIPYKLAQNTPKMHTLIFELGDVVISVIYSEFICHHYSIIKEISGAFLA